MLIAAARARRRSLCGLSCRFWSCGVGVDRGHQALDDPEPSCSALASGARQFVVQEAFEITCVRVGVVLVVVDAHDDREVLVLGRRRDDDLLRARRRGAPGPWSASVKRPVDSITTSTPRSFQGSFAGSLLGEGRDRLAPPTMISSPVAVDVGVEPAEDRVVLQQVRQGLVVGQVVDGDDLDVGTGRSDGAEEVAADPAEAVDTDTNGHEDGTSRVDGERWMSAGLVAPLHQPPDHRREDQLHRQLHLSAGADDGVRTRHERIVQHRQQVGKSMPADS